MAPTPSVRIIKSFTYRGETHEWSNRYHFDGGDVASEGDWDTLMDAITAAEKLIYGSDVTITGAVGYDAGSDTPVYSKTYALVGAASLIGTKTPGDVAALVRYSTTQRSVKNHPIYLFNYYHGMRFQGALSDQDHLATDQKTLLETYAAAWVAGFSDGTSDHLRAGPNGAVAQDYLVEPLLTHRDFRR